MFTPLFFLILGIVGIVGGFVFVLFIPRGVKESEKKALLEYYSSLLSDMNVDYRDQKISGENIHNISVSIQNLTEELSKLIPRFEDSDLETRHWIIDIIEEFQSALALWTERHADEISLYEESIQNNDAPSISLMKKRLESQMVNMRNVIR